MAPADDSLEANTSELQDQIEKKAQRLSESNIIKKRVIAAEKWRADNVRNNLLFPTEYKTL